MSSTLGNGLGRLTGRRVVSGVAPVACIDAAIAEGHNVVEVARQAGHSPKVALDRYAHVFEEFDPTERIDVAECIRNGREELRRRARQPTLFDVA